MDQQDTVVALVTRSPAFLPYRAGVGSGLMPGSCFQRARRSLPTGSPLTAGVSLGGRDFLGSPFLRAYLPASLSPPRACWAVVTAHQARYLATQGTFAATSACLLRAWPGAWLQ